MAPIALPDVIWAESWAEKANMPKGSTQSKARISTKRTSCIPYNILISAVLFSEFGVKDKPRPKAADIIMIDKMFPDKSGWIILFGIIVNNC